MGIPIVLLTAAGSGLATFDLPDSAGIPKNYTCHTISVAYSDYSGIISGGFERHGGGDIGADCRKYGAGPPSENFLQQLREFTGRWDPIDFDEVITGFRAAFGGVQSLFKIEPDLTILGKIVGGGMPLAVYGGRKEIMEKIAPLGPVYQAGTLSGNPVAAAAGSATLSILKEQNPYRALESKTTTLLNPVRELISRKEYPAAISQMGSMWTLFFRKSLAH